MAQHPSGGGRPPSQRGTGSSGRSTPRGGSPYVRRRDRRASGKALPLLEAAVDATEQQWDQIGAPVARRLQAEIITTGRELAELGREAMTERLDRLQGRAAGRSAGLDRGLGL